MDSLPCNCFHSKEDHKDLGTGRGEGEFRTWCIYSEHGQCPCDCYTPMTNLEYLEFKAEQ